ncbi:hypothetical protein M758_11G161900 [Ceratodon purpureus]|nr:hypothetical protein M758_11G161900 [Ceratodon purpureus]
MLSLARLPGPLLCCSLAHPLAAVPLLSYCSLRQCPSPRSRTRTSLYCLSLTTWPLVSRLAMASSSSSAPASPHSSQLKLGRSKTGALQLDGFSIEGVSIGGQETCILLPNLKLAFDIGRCPERAVPQDFLFISHAHMDHIGGVCMYVATRGLFKMKPPTVIVPKCLKATVEKLFEVHRELDGSELKHHLVGLDVGEEFNMGKNMIVKPFKTYHVVPSQGYVVYSVKNKLKPEYVGFPGEKIKELKLSGVEITDTVRVSEVAFTGDTTPDFILDDANIDALQAKLLIMETTFLDDAVTIEHARDYGHTHLFEVLKYADRFKNKSILFIHFSARYKREVILLLHLYLMVPACFAYV